MIRFIDLRGQINDDNDPCFAFYDDVTDHFDTFTSVDSVSAFIYRAQKADWEQSKIDRFCALIPDHYFDNAQSVFCCSQFSEHVQADRPKFEPNDTDTTWNINGCCGGCFVVTQMTHCPFCGRQPLRGSKNADS